MNKIPLPRRNNDNPTIRAYDRAVRRGRKSYHVVPHEDGWAVRRLDASTSRVFGTKIVAVDTAKGMAKRERTELFIHGRDGRIRGRSSYAS